MKQIKDAQGTYNGKFSYRKGNFLRVRLGPKNKQYLIIPRAPSSTVYNFEKKTLIKMSVYNEPRKIALYQVKNHALLVL